MRQPHEPPLQHRDRTTTAAARARRLGLAQKWLDDHPDVPWTAEEFVRAIDRKGQQRAAVDALAEGRRVAAVEAKAQRGNRP